LTRDHQTKFFILFYLKKKKPEVAKATLNGGLGVVSATPSGYWFLVTGSVLK
jgi:hypothetical protein